MYDVMILMRRFGFDVKSERGNELHPDAGHVHAVTTTHQTNVSFVRNNETKWGDSE